MRGDYRKPTRRIVAWEQQESKDTQPVGNLHLDQDKMISSLPTEHVITCQSLVGPETLYMSRIAHCMLAQKHTELVSMRVHKATCTVLVL